MGGNERAKVYTKVIKIYKLLSSKTDLSQYNLKSVSSISDVENIIEDIKKDISLSNDEMENLDAISAEQDEYTQPDEELVAAQQLEETQQLEEAQQFEEAQQLEETQQLDEELEKGLNAKKLENTCSKNRYSYLINLADDASYGVDTFSLRVQATNQSEVDSIIAHFVNSGIQYDFLLNNDGSFSLNIYNRNSVMKTEQLFGEIDYAINRARDDVDYLDNLPNEIKNSQLDFMCEHPDVVDSYFVEQQFVATNGVNAEDLEIVTGEDGVEVEMDEDDNVAIAPAVPDESVDLNKENDSSILEDLGKVILEDVKTATKLLGVVAGIPLAVSALKLASESNENDTMELPFLSAVELNGLLAKPTGPEYNVPTDEISGIIFSLNEDAKENNTANDIIIKPKPDDPGMSLITVAKKDNSGTMSFAVDTDSVSQIVDDISKTMDIDTLKASENSNGTTNFQQTGEGNTLTVIAAPKKNCQELLSSVRVDANKRVIVKPANVYVLTNNNNSNNNGNAAFSNSEILLLSFAVVSMLFGIIFLIIK